MESPIPTKSTVQLIQREVIPDEQVFEVPTIDLEHAEPTPAVVRELHRRRGGFARPDHRYLNGCGG